MVPVMITCLRIEHVFIVAFNFCLVCAVDPSDVPIDGLGLVAGGEAYVIDGHPVLDHRGDRCLA